MRETMVHNSRGVALLAALFVLMVMSILGIGMLANVDEDLKISKNHENSERALKIAEAGIQIARSTFFDPAEEELPDAGFMTLRDPESGEVVIINSSDRRIREKWRYERTTQRENLRDLIMKSGADLVELSTNGPVIEPLTRLFDQRRRRLR